METKKKNELNKESFEIQQKKNVQKEIKKTVIPLTFKIRLNDFKLFHYVKIDESASNSH